MLSEMSRVGISVRAVGPHCIAEDMLLPDYMTMTAASSCESIRLNFQASILACNMQSFFSSCMADNEHR